ncbi:MAG: hypothetical protein U5K76_01090 [Woeseiaceae bacterium]|nr:hypothetical protein [Woeseiaceae bacterium]
MLMGHALKAIGKRSESIDNYRAAWQLKPDYGDAFWSLANTKTYRFTDDEIRHIQRYEADPATSTDDRIHLCFAAGKALEDRGDFDASFEFYRERQFTAARATGLRSGPHRATRTGPDRRLHCGAVRGAQCSGLR